MDDLTPEQRLSIGGIELPPARSPSGSYVPVRCVAGLAFVSGQVSRLGIEDFYRGRVGDEVDLAGAQDAARLCALNMLAQLQRELGSLDKVKGCVKLLGFVNAVPEFAEHPQVMNGASDLMIDVFGEAGRHSRSAIGAGSLPANFAVEVEGIFELAGN